MKVAIFLRPAATRLRRRAWPWQIPNRSCAQWRLQDVMCRALGEGGGVQVSGNVNAHEKERKDAVRQGCRCCTAATGAG